MFVQYSFVQRREQAAVSAPRVEMTPSMVVGAGLAAMVLTICAFVLV